MEYKDRKGMQHLVRQTISYVLNLWVEDAVLMIEYAGQTVAILWELLPHQLVV